MLNIKKQSLDFTIRNEDNINIKNNENIVVNIPTDKIVEIEKQDFKIHQDTIDSIAESIKVNGQLDPCVVTPANKEGCYELLAGRHRKRACEQAGFTTVKCIIKYNISDEDKELIIIDSNTERNNDYLPSELAYAFKHKYEILSKRTNKAIKQIADEGNLSRKKVYRYIRLTYLIKSLLNRVDSGNIPIIAAVEISYLTEQQQSKLFEYLINHTDCKITTKNAPLIKEKPENLDEIFYDDFEDSEKVDNLSTMQEKSVHNPVNENHQSKIFDDDKNEKSVSPTGIFSSAGDDTESEKEDNSSKFSNSFAKDKNTDFLSKKISKILLDFGIDENIVYGIMKEIEKLI